MGSVRGPRNESSVSLSESPSASATVLIPIANRIVSALPTSFIAEMMPATCMSFHLSVVVLCVDHQIGFQACPRIAEQNIGARIVMSQPRADEVDCIDFAKAILIQKTFFIGAGKLARQVRVAIVEILERMTDRFAFENRLYRAA